MLTAQNVIERLHEAITAAGSRKAFAVKYALSEQYLSDVLRGRREPGQKILDALDLERVVAYREKRSVQ